MEIKNIYDKNIEPLSVKLYYSNVYLNKKEQKLLKVNYPLILDGYNSYSYSGMLENILYLS